VPTTKPTTSTEIIPAERIAASIYLIRGQKVMIDSDLATLYNVTTGNLNLAVRRNLKRFPSDFMFQLSQEEFANLKLQIARSSWGGRRHPPYAFTEHGVAMLSSVLGSERAVEVNISIIRAFVELRNVLATNAELSQMVAKHDRQITILFDSVQKLLAPAPAKKTRIGFAAPKS